MSNWIFYSFDRKEAQLTGGDRSVKNLVCGVKRQGICPIFVSQYQGGLAEQLQEEGVDVRIVSPPEILDVYDKKALEYSLGGKARAAYALVRYNQKIKAVAREVQAQGIWARGIRSVLHTSLAALLSGYPLVWDIGVEHHSQGLIRMLHGLGLLFSDRIVTQATAQREHIFGPFLASWYSESFRTLYPGIASDRAARLRESRKTPEVQPPEIINIGSIHPRKNQRMSIRAFEYVRQCHPDATLNFVGSIQDRDYADSLRSCVRSRKLSSNVRFLGWRDDVPELLGRSSMLILSSYREGIPHVIREAMYAAIPVVASAVGGVREAVEDGETGFLVDPDSPKEMGDRINYLLSNPEERERMGEAALQLAQQRFSKEEWLSYYADLLHGLS